MARDAVGDVLALGVVVVGGYLLYQYARKRPAGGASASSVVPSGATIAPYNPNYVVPGTGQTVSDLGKLGYTWPDIQAMLLG